MVTRSRSPKKAADEKYFPIRVRVQVPEEGFGYKLSEIHCWLNTHAGRGRWGWNADNVLSRGARDAVSFYMLDEQLIAPLIEAFELELAQGEADLCGSGSFKLMAKTNSEWCS